MTVWRIKLEGKCAKTKHDLRVFQASIPTYLTLMKTEMLNYTLFMTILLTKLQIILIVVHEYDCQGDFGEVGFWSSDRIEQL